MLNLKVSSDVYSPAEDTFLIAKHIPKDMKGKKVLDMGCGSGMLGIIAAVNGAKVTASDINEEALDNTKENSMKFGVDVKVVRSDLFGNISEKFDLILFNPPYVPEDENSIYVTPGLRQATTSGKRGIQVIRKFLTEFKIHLNRGGKVLMIISSLNNIKDSMKREGWKEIDSDAFFFEKIYLMEYSG